MLQLEILKCEMLVMDRTHFLMHFKKKIRKENTILQTDYMRLASFQYIWMDQSTADQQW